MKFGNDGPSHDDWHKYGSVLVLTIGFILYSLSAGPGIALYRFVGSGLAVVLIWCADDLAVTLSTRARRFCCPATTDNVIRLYGWIALLYSVSFWLLRGYGFL